MTELDDDALAAIRSLDLDQMPEWAAKKFRLIQERPDLMWCEDDTDAERARKQAEFDALMLAREPKH